MRYLYAIIAFCCINLGTPLYAGIEIYLKARAVSNGGPVLLHTIATIKANDNDYSLIKNISFSKNDLRDGNIDRSEVKKRLNDYTTASVLIYGNATRIIQQDVLDQESNNDSETVPYIKRGTTVKYSVNNRGVRIETYGTVMKSGYKGDVVPVKIKRSRIVKGRIINWREVTLDI